GFDGDHLWPQPLATPQGRSPSIDPGTSCDLPRVRATPVLGPPSGFSSFSRGRTTRGRAPADAFSVGAAWGAFPGSERAGRPRAPHRRLPVLIATNPQHYGRVAQLNTVEALCAALYVLGRPEEAERVISGFAGGEEFLEVNRDRLERYSRAVAPDDITAAEKLLFGGS